jgi:hypothetical protein
MNINKNSIYEQTCKWLIIGIMFAIISSIMLFALGGNIVFILCWLFFISIFGLLNFVFIYSRVADIELHEEYFSLITIFQIDNINYKDFNIYNIERNPRPIKFFIYSNYKKHWIAYSEKNYIKIKALLIKTKSKYTLNNFEEMIMKFEAKPGFFDL